MQSRNDKTELFPLSFLERFRRQPGLGPDRQPPPLLATQQPGSRQVQQKQLQGVQEATALSRGDSFGRVRREQSQVLEAEYFADGVTWERYLNLLVQDIQGLLNTRRHVKPGSLERYEYAKRSLLMYGLPDFSAADPQSEEAQKELKKEIEEVLSIFEPRIEVVDVKSPQIHASGQSHTIQFQLTANVEARPAPIRVVFGTTWKGEQFECTVLEEK